MKTFTKYFLLSALAIFLALKGVGCIYLYFSVDEVGDVEKYVAAQKIFHVDEVSFALTFFGALFSAIYFSRRYRANSKKTIGPHT